MSLDRRTVLAAAERLRGIIRRTPVLRCEALDDVAGAELWIKAENLQHIGAFKARGAMHAIGRLTEAQRANGVITYSSGNHAQAVALAAKHYGLPAEIAMPVDAPKVKVQVVKALGARITFAGRTSIDRHQAAMKIQTRTGGTIIEPFDHPDIIAGQGTATLELIEEVKRMTGGGTLDALLVPVGGGGLIAGACLVAGSTKVYSVEPLGCDAMAKSLAAGERVAVEPGPTIADGLKPTRVGELNFHIASQHVAGSYTVNDEDIGRAVVRLLLRAKVLAEPSGAATVAVALRRELPGNPKRIGVLLSGGNIAPTQLGELIATYARQV